MGSVRAIGGTADTSIRLNRVLSKHFGLAAADESYVKLTDLMDGEAIQRRLEGWDALILGNDVSYQYRPVTGGTFEKSPNDKTFEVYWDAPKGFEVPNRANVDPIQEQLVLNVIEAAQRAGIQHIVAVENRACGFKLEPRLESLSSRMPYTIIRHEGLLTTTENYTYHKGVQGRLRVSRQTGGDDNLSSTWEGTSLLTYEDVAALCVQTLHSLKWTESRCVDVRCNEMLTSVATSGMRPDQEWVVNSYLLEDALLSVS
jgi:hypothetical protein